MLVHQARQRVEARAGHLLRGLDGRTSGEDREARERLGLVRAEQAVAPLDRREERPVALGRVTGSTSSRSAPLGSSTGDAARCSSDPRRCCGLLRSIAHSAPRAIVRARLLRSAAVCRFHGASTCSPLLSREGEAARAETIELMEAATRARRDCRARFEQRCAGTARVGYSDSSRQFCNELRGGRRSLYPSARFACGGPRYGNSGSRSSWGPTWSSLTFPFVRMAMKGSATSSVSVRPLSG